MFVYLFLSFANRFVPASAYGTPLRRVDRAISDRHFSGTAPSVKYLQYGDTAWQWNALTTHPEDANKDWRINPGKGNDSVPHLEISKSIELTFDPNVRALSPANAVVSPGNSRNEEEMDAYKSSLSLLTFKTRQGLYNILEKYGGESKGGGLTEVKNYQTGRFKLHHLKGRRFGV